ncbi:MAG: hypothetical protein HY039_07165 [Nitrospirae bacterium]|nr:hypothetical protein [Nitrospirota bacterium]
MKKAFDCVLMKHKIQARQRACLKGFSAVEESRFIQASILKDDALARIWNAAVRTKVSTSSGVG